MANAFTVTAGVKLDPRSLNQSAQQVKQALGRITGQASEFQKSLDASTARVFAFGATTVVLNSVTQAFKQMVSSTIEVEKRLTEINAIFQQTESVMNSFRESIFDVAKSTGQAFSTVADAAGELARQGLSAEETTKRLEAALILTRISGLGAEDSVKSLTAAINGFTSAALTAEDVTNKIVAVDTAFAVSAQDLAQGLSRAGSTAEDAGVSFDQLLGLITAVEQRTARGGAVIGNAFKSIFTRLSRGSTIQDLQELGVQINASQTGVQKLQALSNALENVSDPTVASKIKELAGGVFQINVVSATLKDLSNETSIYAKATKEAANSANQAYERNKTLNETLATQINALVVNVTNLASKLGNLTFGPLLENLIGIANKATEAFNDALSPDKGNAIVKGFIKGIGLFLSGPGLVIITTAFLKIVKLVGKFAIDGFRALQKIGTASERIKQIEGGIVGLLSRDEELRKLIGSSTATQAQKEEAVIAAIKRENTLLTQQEALLQRITALAAKRGVTGFSSSGGFRSGRKRFSEGYVPRYSGGYIPNYAKNSEFALEEMEAKALGATGSVKAKMSKGKIGGRRFIMNDQETEIPNFGKNGDSAVIPKYAKGYIPNFAAATKLTSFIQDKIFKSKKDFLTKLESGVKSGQIKPSTLQQDKTITLADGTKKVVGLSAINKSKDRGLEKRKAQEQKDKNSNAPIDLNRRIVGGRLPAILTPQLEEKSSLQTKSKPNKELKGLNFRFPVRGIDRSGKLGIRKDFQKKFNVEKIQKNAEQQALKAANKITRALGKPVKAAKDIKDTDAVKGFIGAVRSSYGGIFDAAVTTALKIKSGPQGEGGDFDVKNSQTKAVRKLFGGSSLPRSGVFSGFGDFKITSGAGKSMKGKTIKELRESHPTIYDKLRKEKKDGGTRGRRRKSIGYIPNFASDGFVQNFAMKDKALKEAVSRERSAGVAMSKIRVEQSNRLKNIKNPKGLAVTNTDDEPRGLVDVFAAGRDKEKQNAASGYIPNFAAAGLVAKGVPKFLNALEKVSTSFGALIGVSVLSERATENGTKQREQEKKQIEENIKVLQEEAKQRAENQKKDAKGNQKELDNIAKTLETSLARIAERGEEQKAAVDASKTQGEKTTTLLTNAVLAASVGIPLVKSLGGGLKSGFSKLSSKLPKAGAASQSPLKPKSFRVSPRRATQTAISFGADGKTISARDQIVKRTKFGFGKEKTKNIGQVKRFRDGKLVEPKKAGRLGKAAQKVTQSKGFQKISQSGAGKAIGRKFTETVVRSGGMKTAGAIFAGTAASVLGAAAAGWEIGVALDNADLNPIQRIVEGGSKKEIAKKEAVESDKRNFNETLRVLPQAVNTGLTKAFGSFAPETLQKRQTIISERGEQIKSASSDAERASIRGFKQQDLDIEAGTSDLIAEVQKNVIAKYEEEAKGIQASADARKNAVDASNLSTAAKNLEKQAIDKETKNLLAQNQISSSKDIKLLQNAREQYTASLIRAASLERGGQAGAAAKVRSKAESKLAATGAFVTQEGGFGENQRKIQNEQKRLEEKIKQVNKSYDQLVENTSASAAAEYDLLNSREIAAQKLDAISKLIPEGVGGDVLRRQTQQTAVNVRGKEKGAELSRAKGKEFKEKSTLRNLSRAQADGGSFTSNVLSEAYAKQEEEVKKATVARKEAETAYNQSILEAGAQAAQSLKQTGDQIKSLGGPAFQEAFQKVQEASLAAKAPDATSADKGAFEAIKKAFEQQTAQEQSRQINANQLSALTAGLGRQEEIRSGVPDFGQAIQGVKDAFDTSKSKSEQRDALAEIEPILKAIEAQFGSGALEVVLAKGGVSATEFNQRKTEAEKSDLRGQLGDQGIKSSTIDDIVKVYEERIKEEADNAKIFDNPEQLKGKVKILFDSYEQLGTAIQGYTKALNPDDAALLGTAVKALVTEFGTTKEALKPLADLSATIGGFATKADKTVEGASAEIDRLQANTTTLQQGVDDLEKSIGGSLKAIEALQKKVDSLL